MFYKWLYVSRSSKNIQRGFEGACFIFTTDFTLMNSGYRCFPKLLVHENEPCHCRASSLKSLIGHTSCEKCVTDTASAFPPFYKPTRGTVSLLKAMQENTRGAEGLRAPGCQCHGWFPRAWGLTSVVS